MIIYCLTGHRCTPLVSCDFFVHRVQTPNAQVRLEHRSFKTPSNRVVELTTVASNYHIEMSPGDAGIYDRYVVQVIIYEQLQQHIIVFSFFVSVFCVFCCIWATGYISYISRFIIIITREQGRRS